MIVVMARVQIDAQHLDALRAAAAEMERDSRAEPGCLEYAFTVELNDPATVRVFERWSDPAALQAHFATPHMARFTAALSRHPPRSVEAKVFEVARELPLPGR